MQLNTRDKSRWLYWGDLSGIDLLQVKRALTIWIALKSHIPKEHVRRDITQTIRRIEGPHATDRRPLIEE
jgi:hypothetical protein